MRKTSIGLAAMIVVGCGPADESPNDPNTSSASTTSSTSASSASTGAAGSATTSSSSSTSAATGSTGNGGASSSSSSASGSAGSSSGGAGSTGSGGTGGAGTGGTGGSGGGAGGASPDGGAPDASVTDSGAPKSDAPRDVVPDSPSRTRQVARPINMPYAKNGYWEYLPPGYGDGTQRPLLMFWHGIGENGAGTAGAELNRVLVNGPPKIINANQWTPDRPFIVLSPQHPGGGCPTATEVRDFTTHAMSYYDVDPTRVYLTGLSCGARGSWAYLGQFKGEKVVAAALIAGDSSVAFNAAGCSLLDTVGIWCVHGANDNPAADSAGMANFMQCPQPRKDAMYTLVPNANHPQSWEAIYDNPMQLNIVLSWFLSQHK